MIRKLGKVQKPKIPDSLFCSASCKTIVIIVMLTLNVAIFAKNPYRKEFFNAYPQAEDTMLDSLLSNDEHCGLCHNDFNGGGARNLFGLDVEETDKSAAAILALGTEDSDKDGFSNDTEILDTANFDNTPTFPGLKAYNFNLVLNVDTTEIEYNLTPSTGSDTTPPQVTVIYPNGG